ncbi:MAG: carbohydrate kinase [Burkholderiales bacterium]
MFVVAGENLVDLVVQADGNYYPAPGGAPFNVACALALQGMPTGYLNPISSDVFGGQLLRTLDRAGARHLGPFVAAPTSLAVVATNERGEARYSFYRSEVADRSITGIELAARTPAGTLAFHTGGLALVPPDTMEILTVLHEMQARRVIRCIDVNARPAVVASMGVTPADYRDAVMSALALADIVKVSDEDFLHLGIDSPPEAASHTLLSLGPKLVVLTLGSAGAVAISPSVRIACAACPVAVVDSVGAGDCFFAGFLAWLAKHGALALAATGGASAPILDGALRHATACAAIDLGRRGCQPATWTEASAFECATGGSRPA